jgi:hypothetical protein
MTTTPTRTGRRFSALSRKKSLTAAAAAAAASAAVLALTGTPAVAATTEQPTATSGVGYAWFNSGTHNMAKGRNSFTVKDNRCGDGYITFVYYEVYDNRDWDSGSETYTYSGKLASGQVVTGDCSEVSRSIYGQPANTDYIRWVIGDKRVSSGAEKYGFWRHDVIW